MLDLAAVRESLRPGPVAWTIHYIDRVDSTNRHARGLGHGAVVVTDFQEAGRGRRGRRWLAPFGTSVLLTAVLDLPPTVDPTGAPMIAVLAVQDALRHAAGMETAVKWPNDVVVDGRRKIAGVLLEGIPNAGGMRVLTGMGINCNFLPAEIPDLPTVATSVRAETGSTVGREAVIGMLLARLGDWHETLMGKPDLVFETWRSALMTPGRTVRVEGIDGAWDGEAIDVRRDGALLVRGSDGATRPVLAADVSIRIK